MLLNDKVVFITGASRGLGRAIALCMSRAGAQVAAMARTEADLRSLARQIENEGGGCLICPGNVAVLADLELALDTTRRKFGGVDVIVNNAAIMGPPRLEEDATPERWTETLQVNLVSAFHVSRLAVPTMRERGGGRIINVTSGLGHVPYPRFCAYSVSKAGIDQLTRCLAAEYGHLNIHANAIDPGVLDTRLQAEVRELGPEHLGSQLHRKFQQLQDRRLLAEPESVAPLAVFLASSAADHINGHIGSIEDYQRLGFGN